ncbi:rho GTPase-activating protein 24-like [Corapipo altera]|uniref:rho GTPase-activating protein 24-like n=1 Tax=Corapipo altera TaxID=415028 RepID=UPI000FD641C3|nr:rho GTPase-activating protein 24-like [Corapipo altera]
MSEKNTPSRYLTRLAHPEDCQETSAAVSPVLQEQEDTGHIPGDSSDSCASTGDSPANPPCPQHHPADLRMLMARQKAEYESKIARLEQQNRALQLEIQGMHWKLGQQRKWYRLVEVKMRNAERAKEDAERRNEMLQKEMEEFFETFGEMNRWK